tara:strand:+ start:180 stop:1916 length:1737 start_codon:yes stop_codon:yes gene_type:complete
VRCFYTPADTHAYTKQTNFDRKQVDRNTLLAFLLISLVLIFTPFYMDLVNPKPETEKFEEQIDTPPPNPTENTTKKQTETEVLEKTTKLKTEEESFFTLETDLYEVVISNKNGGSIVSFKLFEYLTHDSFYVNLINELNKNNLSIDLRSINGEDIDLTGPWFLKQKPTVQAIKEVTTLVFFTNSALGRIEKSLTFFPGSYAVQVDINTEAVSSSVFANQYLFSWKGGLPPTEKNETDDLLYTNSFLFQGGELEKIKADGPNYLKVDYNGLTDWVSTRTKYFTASFIPNKNTQPKSAVVGSQKKGGAEIYDLSLVLSASTPSSILLYLGPLEYERIKSLTPTLGEIMSFGWGPIKPISKGVLWTLKKMRTFIPNYGFILILFAITVKFLVYPLTKKSYESTQAMQRLAPEINKLKEKYKNNPQKLNQATMQMYKDRGVNPLGGCLPMLLQMPLLFALFVVFRSTIELRAEPFVFWIRDLSSPDVIFTLPFSIPIYGDGVAVLPILMGLSMFVQQKMMSGGVAQQPQQKMMQYFMSVFFFLLFNQFPSGLNLYYTLFNVLTIVQQKVSPQKTFSPGKTTS